MSLFKIERNSTTAGKKKQEDINVKIDQLTNFYNALADDTNMALVIDKLEEIHDKVVSLQENIQHLKEEKDAFERKFDEDLNYSDTAISTIRTNAVAAIEKAINEEVSNDIKAVKNSLNRIKERATDKLEEVTEEILSKVQQNNEHIINLKLEKESFNWLGAFLVGLIGCIFIAEVVFLFNDAVTNKQIRTIILEQEKHTNAINYIKNESDERFEGIKSTFSSIGAK